MEGNSERAHAWFEYWRALIRGEAELPPPEPDERVMPRRKDIDD